MWTKYFHLVFSVCHRVGDCSCLFSRCKSESISEEFANRLL